jgi:oligopeptide transport system permease protein
MAMSAIMVEEAEGVHPRSVGLWRDVWRRLRRHRVAMVGLVVVLLLVALALVAPLLTDLGVVAHPLELDTENTNAGMSGEHLLGTDYLGRDLLSRAIYGARVSLAIGVLVQVVVLLIGGTVGLIAGYFGGRIDLILMRFTDVMFSFPDLLFVLFVASVLGSGFWNIFVAIGLVSWVFLARLVRGEVLVIKEQDYIMAARATGTRPGKVILRHVVPNSLGPVIVTLTFGIPATIFTEAFLSFLGVGLSPPTPSWGVMINEGYHAIFTYPNQVVAPALAISLTTLAFNFLGDGLRDALDVRTRSERNA